MKAIPTWYGGIRFRSKLEAQWAKFLDYHNVPWVYEPDGYEFEDGTRYLPDFWLPDSHQWFEVKGVMTDKDMHKCDMLAKESGHDVLIGYPGGFVELIEVDGGFGDWGHMDDVSLTRCTVCGRAFFFSNDGGYRCRCCGEHDGDHQLGRVIDLNEVHAYSSSDYCIRDWPSVTFIDIEPRGDAR